MYRRLLRRRRSVASIGIVTVTSLAITVAAFLYQGFTTADVELNDGGVWVTKPSGLLVGHLNYQSQVLDAGLRTKASDFEIMQAGNSVLTFDKANETLSLVDPANVLLGKETPLPASAIVALGGDTVAILDPSGGELFVMTVAEVATFAVETAEPLVELGAGGAVTVGADGTAYAVSAADGQVVTVSPAEEGFSAPAITALDGIDENAELVIAAVGDAVVVYDTAAATLYLPNGKTAPVDDGEGAVLQQSGPVSDAVLVATGTSLVSQPLDGGAAVLEAAGASGVPAAPVMLGGCAYAAWAGSARYLRDCPGTADDIAQDVDRLQDQSSLTFRVNRKVVVLNDLTSGLVWLVDQDMVLVDNWSDVTPPSDELDDDKQDDAVTNSVENVLPDRGAENTVPVAEDDSFGVRPGRSVILPVLDNDTDSDGDVLTATVLGDGPAIGQVQPIFGGAALQINVDDAAAGASSFRYEVSDGRGGIAEATVTLSVSAPGTNSPPVQTRPSSFLVEQGASTNHNVLPDWIDPDGDDLFLSGAASADDDAVTFRADGVVSYAAIGQFLGRKDVTIVVSDGLETAEGVLRADVRAAGTAKPITNPDHVTAVVGQAITISPLLNDVSPSGVPLRLAKLDEVAGTTLVPDFAAGTFAFTSTVAKTHYVQYLASDGPNTVLGLVRIDVQEPAASTLPPVAVRDVALLPGGRQVLVDVLQNDSDPQGGILVVQSVSVPDSIGVGVAVLDHRILQITDDSGLSAPVTIGYTVSNGTLTAEGEVLVIPVPAPAKLRPPVAVDDSVTVRVGDIVTIAVLANDFHPDNDAITLSPALVEPLVDPADGALFIAENTLRFQAGSSAKTVYATYEVVDSQGQKDAGYVTIQILAAAPETNSPPRPLDLTARVLAGSTVRIPVPLDQIDPDGDSVEFIGQATAPKLGRVVEVGAGWLSYEAYPESTGTDSFTYVVRDRVGASATGTVLVGIAQPGAVNQKPVAVKDTVTARPGRKLAVPVLVNDTDPDGDLLTLVADSLELPVGLDATVSGDRVVIRTPQDSGEFSIRYTVADPWGATAVGTVQLTVSPDTPLLVPIARDDRVSTAEVTGQKAVEVTVLDNDEDPDGVAADLTVTVEDPAARVDSAGVVTVTLAAAAQIIRYTVTDADDLAAYAFILVPGLGELRPVLTADVKPVEVKSGKTVTLRLADYVTVADGKSTRITSADKVSAAHANGAALIADETTLVYTSVEGYFGPDAISFEVTDGTGPDDPEGRTAILSIPVTVLAPANVPPGFVGGTIEVAPGEAATSVDLRAMSTDADPGDLAKLSYRLLGDVPAGFTLSVSGQTLSASAKKDATTGSTGVVQVSISDGTNEAITGTLGLRVTASSRPLATTTDDVVAAAQQGKASTVSVLDNDTSPFPDEALTIVSATVETGDGSAAVSGSNVVVTPAADFIGTMVVRYRVADATKDAGRQVDGRIRLTVQGRPDAPSTPSVTSIQDRTVVLSWTPPSNNGSEITGYTVNAGQGFSQACASTTCTLSGLTNDVEYSFTVTATNTVGTSDPSVSSAPARPDARPDVPQPPTLVFGDTSVTVSWSAPTSTGSPVSSYTLEISPQPQFGAMQKSGVTGNSTSWDGLENGVSYQVRIQAVNRAPSPSDWSTFSAGVVPAGVPAAPAAPTTTPATPVGSQAQISVSWAAPAANGDPIADYTLTTRRGGSVVNTLVVSGTSASVAVDASETDYTFTVSARNKAGSSAASGASSPRRGAVAPGAPTNVVATATDGGASVTFTPGPLNGNRAGELSYQYTVNQTGASGTFPSGGGSVGGLSNGTDYTVNVWAVSTVEGVSPGPAATSNVAKPFGKPIITLQAINRQDNAVQFVWNVNGNGRQLTSSSHGVDGNGNGSAVVGGLPASGTGSITVTYANEAGSASASWSGQANDPPPPPRAWVTRNGQVLTYHWENIVGGWGEVSKFRCYNVPPNKQQGTANIVSEVAGALGAGSGEVSMDCGAGANDSYSIEPWKYGPWLQVNGQWNG